jgi:hypothetical protein
MKRILFFIALFATVTTFAQRKSPHDTVSSKKATVTYGRPYKDSREVFGKLVPYSKVWRLGADQATTITFNQDSKFGDKEIKAGTYAIFAVPNENEWTIIVNGEPNQWGSFAYEKNKSKDVAQFTVPVKKLDSPVEQLTIRFDEKNTMVVEWENTQIAIPLKDK